MEEKLKNLCSVKKEDFDEIFNDFFDVRNINQTELEEKIDKTKIYNNYEIKKVEIKKELNYSDFLDKLLEKFNSYYYDWNRDWKRDIKYQKKAYEWINNYTPKTGILLEDFKKEVFWWKVGEYFLDDDKLKQLKKGDKDLIIKYLKTSTISNVLELEKWKKYILLSKHNKISIQSESKILWYLHWDIWEFILYFLVEWFLKSPILFSKIRHSKSSWALKINWTDWIHFKIDEWAPKFLFLESKFKKDFSLCVEETIWSQKKLLENEWEWDINNELHILESKWPIIWNDFDIFFENWFEDFINPYYIGDKDQKKLPFDLVSWIIYELIDTQFIEEKTVSKIKTLLEWYKDIEKLIGGRKVTIFLLPLVDNEEILKQFLDKTKT